MSHRQTVPVFKSCNKQRATQEVNVGQSETWMRIPERSEAFVCQSKALVSFSCSKLVPCIVPNRFEDLRYDAMIELQY
jgi:hypothetical protein